MKTQQRLATWMTAGLLAVAVLNSGCASMQHRAHRGDPAVRPGPYPGVRTDLRTIGNLPEAVKTMSGGDRFVVATCIPLGAALFLADIPLSATVDSFCLPSDLRAAKTGRR